jgi:HUS1 checkpoint protein
VVPTLERELHHFATARVDIRDLLKIIHVQVVQPSNVVCCIMEHHAVVFYIYLDHARYYPKAKSAHEHIDSSQIGTFTYYLPIKLS